MALVMTILTVLAALGAISLLLWLSAYVEARHLGPTIIDLVTPEAAAAPVLSVVETAHPAAA